MKFSTRARYGLRLMVELARLQQTGELIQLKKIAHITGLSNNYLGQLAMSLKNNRLLVGVSGKKGGYRLGRPADKINLNEIIKAVHGPVFATECVIKPDHCLNAEFCEARMIWSLLTHSIQEILESYTLADLIDPKWMHNLKEKHPEIQFLHLDKLAADTSEDIPPGCPSEIEK